MINPILLRAFINDCNEYEWRVRLMPGLSMSNSDLAAMWLGRPKGQPHFERNAYTAVIDGARSVRITSNTHVDWRGLL